MTAAPDAAAAAARYDDVSLRAAEEQRERAQQAIIAELRRRYVDGPVLIVPRAGSGSVNNMGATVIPGVGTVFRSLATKGAWGFFEAPGGAGRRPSAPGGWCSTVWIVPRGAPIAIAIVHGLERCAGRRALNKGERMPAASSDRSKKPRGQR